MKTTVEELREMIAALQPLHKQLNAHRPSDWLSVHKEPGQTFLEYINCNPVLPGIQRKTIFIQPIGKFSKKQRQIILLTASFLTAYFNLEVKINGELPLEIIPDSARRIHPQWGIPQLLSPYILDALLIPRLPEDAMAFIAFTASDLWPGMGWNFVFGQASIRDRVGVWSMYRNGDPERNVDELHLCLRRTLNTAVHETAHMFSLLHCTLYQCVMSGSNNRSESDRRPLTLCPECLAKICWATHTDPLEHYKNLLVFFEDNRFEQEIHFCQESIRVIGYHSNFSPMAR